MRIIGPTFQMRKQRIREVQNVTQSQRASKGQDSLRSELLPSVALQRHQGLPTGGLYPVWGVVGPLPSGHSFGVRSGGKESIYPLRVTVILAGPGEGENTRNGPEG